MPIGLRSVAGLLVVTIFLACLRLRRRAPERPMVLAPAMSIRGDEELKATWISHSQARWTVFLLGLAAATVGVVMGMQTSKSCSPYYTGPDPSGNQITLTDCTDNYPYLVPGSILLGLGLTTMVIPLLVHDSVQIVPTGR